MIEKNNKGIRISSEKYKNIDNQNLFNGRAMTIIKIKWLNKSNVNKRYGSIIIYLFNKEIAD
jgi:hypothetical protein